MMLTVYSDVNTVGLDHPGSSRNKVSDFAVELSVFVLLLHLQAQLARHWEQTTGFSSDAGRYVHHWKNENTNRQGKEREGNGEKDIKLH